MKTAKKQYKTYKMSKIGLVLTLVFVSAALVLSQGKEASAAVNIIRENSFEGDISSYWGIWKKESSVRSYQLFRAYDAPFGYGSYSAAIEAKGSPEEPFSAVMSSNALTNKFSIDASKDYYLIFYARADKKMDLIAYLQKADNYAAITEFKAETINDKWQKFFFNFSPTVSGDASLVFVYGDMPADNTLYIDGIQLIENDILLASTEVKGYIGDERFVSIRNIGAFNENDISIELPYYDNLTKTVGEKKFKPTRIVSSGVYFKIPERTFSGIGKAYVSGNYVGMFDYNILTKLDSFHPGLVRVDQDLVISGSGFSPKEKNNIFLVVNAVNHEKEIYQRWIAPETADSNLKQMSFKLPSGTISGSMVLHNSFFDKSGTERINKSNALSYNLKPVVSATDWSERGYEHVGDKLRISGKGFGLNPSVVFYDQDGVKLEVKRATIVNIGEVEEIEVQTTKKTNNFEITVLSGNVESDRSSYLNYVAKPKITRLVSRYGRALNTGSEKISAAKIGDIITISGEGFKGASGTIAVEFQGNGKRISVDVQSENINRYYTSLTVAVPAGAQNGYLNVKTSGKDSNYIALEIVPTVLSINPEPVVPGEEILISANGVGSNLNLAKVSFKLSPKEEVIVVPHSIDLSGENAKVRVMAPLAMSNDSTKINLQYDRWSDNGDSVLNVRPHISSANINLDNKILSIKGHGFSINPRENVIAYKYADQDKTEITPSVRMLGVYPTEEGQEIRIQVNDNYHYGFLTVTVGEYTSNEINFGPTSIHSIARRIEYVKSENKVMGVLYISGYNFGKAGKVYVGGHEAREHYRSEFFIIAVLDQAYVYDNPVQVTRE